MKNVYEVLEISLVTFSEDIVTESTPGTFNGKEHEFGNPNAGKANNAGIFEE